MATVAQKSRQKTAGAVAARALHAQALPLTMVAGATVSASITLPANAWLSTIQFETATAISGAPTNINARTGTAAAGQQVVADVDVKAQGHVTGTIVAALDKQGFAATGPTTLFFQLAAVGGTSPAGTVNAIIHYFPAPNS